MRTQVMRTVVLAGVAGAALVGALASVARAQAATVASDRAAGYILFPRIVSDPNDVFNRNQRTETVVQLTNTDNNERYVHCFYVNATGRCSSGLNASGGQDCRSNADCLIEGRPGGRCDTRIWQEINFTLTLSPQQPTGWLVSEGRNVHIVIVDPNDPNGVAGEGFGRVLPVNTDYFQGELKCVEVDSPDTVVPINANHLKGEATTYVVTEDPNDPNDATIDVTRYNAIGIQARSDNGQAQNDQVLCLGGNGIAGNTCENAEYASCPERLVLNHFFEGALAERLEADPSITLVPCTERILEQTPTLLTVQMLVFNEFEQRFSLSTQVECYREINLRELSILFDVGTQGTVAGQTIFRAVQSGDPRVEGPGILGVAQVATIGGSAAYNLVYSGLRERVADFVTYVVTED